MLNRCIKGGLMENVRMEDAEAIRNLWDEVEALARDARRLAELAAGLTHTVRRFAETYTADRPADPRPLLLEVGGALELCQAVDSARSGMEDAMFSLVVALVPRPDPHARIEARARESLRVRLRTRRRPPAEHRP